MHLQSGKDKEGLRPGGRGSNATISIARRCVVVSFQ